MREGSLDAPVRHPIAWQDPDFTDPAKIEAELRRVFDICHGCRRCFNLCDSFPTLFDLIDASRTGELDAVESKDFKPVVDGCTLCDMCFMTKCPYVPPHAFDLDFPHLMLRYRAMEAAQGALSFAEKQLAATDRNGMLAGAVAPLANWATKRSNTAMRGVLAKAADLDPRAELPRYDANSFLTRAKRTEAAPNPDAPAFGRKAVLYATCFVTYNDPGMGQAARAVLARNGVATEVVHPQCCGMPLLEQGRIAEVAASARAVAAALGPWIDQGYDVIALVPSCALMLKFEWPLILPDDPAVKRLAQATFDISEYVVGIARKEGLAPGMAPIPGGVAVHLACHARAQNMGQKAADLLRLIPETEVAVVERCSGHGGSWGFRRGHFDTAMKIGRPAARQLRDAGKGLIASECPLAGAHLAQAIEALDGDAPRPARAGHPIEIMARAYGLA
ncbi:MAG: glycerol-3-phosphate dehydrogenase [Rhodospirillales bacterium]|nr:glycerol-3-phosphate dehydrogenase [Rhodospirillales bacterium]